MFYTKHAKRQSREVTAHDGITVNSDCKAFFKFSAPSHVALKRFLLWPRSTRRLRVCFSFRPSMFLTRAQRTSFLLRCCFRRLHELQVKTPNSRQSLCKCFEETPFMFCTARSFRRYVFLMDINPTLKRSRTVLEPAWQDHVRNLKPTIRQVAPSTGISEQQKNRRRGSKLIRVQSYQNN